MNNCEKACKTVFPLILGLILESQGLPGEIGVNEMKYEDVHHHLISPRGLRIEKVV